MIISKDVHMNSPIVEKEHSCEMPEEEVKFFIDLKFQSDNLCANVHDVSWENKTSVEDDEIFDISENFKEDQPTLICTLSLIV